MHINKRRVQERIWKSAVSKQDLYLVGYNTDMNNVELEERIVEFIKRNRVIMIDGPWGSGKTYAINEYIKSRDGFNKKIIYYTSLFGTESISDLSREIFMWLHPFLAYINSNVNVSLSFLKGVFKTDIKLDYALKGKDKINNGNGKIIILDDLERVNYDKVCISDLLGFIERLTIYGFTVVIITNSSELKVDERLVLDKFNEKVIEVKIKVDDCANSILDQQFNNLEVSLKGLYEFFDFNIRLASRVRNVYKDIEDNLKTQGVSYNKDTLFSLCVHTITGIYTNVGYLEYKTSLNENNNAIDFSRTFRKNEWMDKELATRLNFALNRGGLLPSPENMAIMKGVAKFNYDGDINQLADYYKKQDSVLNEDSFFYSDEGKEELYRKKIEVITGEGYYNKELVANELFKMDYEGYGYLITENYDKLKKTLSTAYYMKYIRNSSNVDEWCRESVLFKKLVEDSIGDYKKEYCEKTAKDIEERYKKGKYKEASKICEDFCNLRYSEYPLDILADSFKNNNYYLDHIGETISKEYWNFVSYVAVIIKYANRGEEYKNILDKIKKDNPNNRSLEQRLVSLENRATSHN